jgi:hypothetical protein
MKITTDKWHLNRNNSIEMEVENKHDLRALLKKLDGKTTTQLIAEGNNGLLLIGGGPDQFVVTNIIGEHEEFYNLINKDLADNKDEIELVTGGQSGLFAKKLCNNFDNTLQALQYFFSHSKSDPGLIWAED